MQKGIFLIIILLVITPYSEGLDWSFSEILFLNDVIAEEHSFDKTTLSPDGNLIAWVERENLCIHNLESSLTDCYSWEWELSFMTSQIGYSNIFMQWSPNGKFIALSQDPFFQRFDSDIWIFDTVEKTFTNLTPDNFSGQITSTQELDIPTIDYLPIWVSSDQLVFFRTTQVQDLDRVQELNYFYEGLQLLSISLESKEVELVIDLSEYMLAGNSAAAVSPMGDKIALVAPEIIDNPIQDSRWGLWIIDLRKFNIQKLSGQSDWEILLPSESVPDRAYPRSNRSIGWLSDNQTILTALTWAIDDNILIPVQFATDITTQNISPIIDYRNSDTPDESLEFSFVTIIQHDNLWLNYIALSIKEREFLMYETYYPFDTQTGMGIVNMSTAFTDGISIMSRNGNALINENTILKFNSSQENE